MNIHLTMRITDGICDTNKKLFVTVNPKTPCKLEIADKLWLTFINQPQSYVVVFVMIYFQMFKTLVTEFKHAIGPDDIIKFNSLLENVSTATIELTNIDEYSHEKEIVIVITKI